MSNTTGFGGLAIAATLAAGVSTLAITLAQAASHEAASRIDRVVLYPDAAIITRQLVIDIPAGSHEIIVPDLPHALDPASLRVEGSGEARLVLGGIDLRLRPATPQAEAELTKKLKTLRAERDRLLDRIEAVEGRKAMIQRLANGAGEGKDQKPLDIEQFMRAADAVGKGLLVANEELRGFRTEEARLDEEIAAIEAAKGEPGQAKPRRVAVLPVEAQAATKATLQISYRVTGASWRPVYDARLETRGAKPALDLTRRAMIRQNTGEDWADATLVLSTLRVARGTASPALSAMRVGFYERPQPLPAPVARAAPAAPEAMMMAAEADQRRKSSEAPARLAMAEAQASMEATAFQAEFAVPGRIALPSGREEKSIRLGSDKLEPSLRHKSVPEVDPTAYLEAAFTWQGAAPLLAGEVLLNRDGAFIGRGRVKDIAGGEETRFGFGADDRVKITRVPLSREAREPGLLGSTKTDEMRFRIDLKNLHAFPVQLIVLDRQPVSEDREITVERLADMSKPDLENVEDRRGVFGWSAELKPQEAKSYLNAYRIRWPAGREIRNTPIPK